MSLLPHWLPEDQEVSAKPPEGTCGDHSAVTAGANVMPRGVEIMSPPPAWGKRVGDQGHRRLFTV